MKIKENSLIIIENGTKEQFIKEFRQTHPLFAATVLELDEFQKKYYFDYTTEAVFYIHKKYRVIKEIAEIYLENIYFLKEDIDTPKTTFLKNLKIDLEQNGLLLYDEQFRTYLKDKDIYLYKLEYVDNFYKRTFEEIEKIAHVHYIEEEEESTSIKPLYKLSNREQEVAFVASEIASLLKKGIDIDKIKLTGVKEDYTFALRQTFKEFHIPIELPTEETIASTILFSKFIEYYEGNIKITLEKLKEYVKSEKDEKVFKTILDTLNEYYWCEKYEDVFEFIVEDLKKKKIPPKHLKRAVKIIDILKDKIMPDDYIYLIGFNQGSFPTIAKDEDYLNDETKRKLGLSDSIDTNKKRATKARHMIETIKNLTVTYRARDLKGELYISNIYDEMLFQKETPHISFEHSDEYNRRILLCAKDENRKYGTNDETLQTLLAHYIDEPYMTFDNTFKGIPADSLREFLEGKLTLSYSSMDDYYKCSFRYYLDYILHVNKFEDSFATVTGTIFHEVLSHCFADTFDFDTEWSKALGHTEFEFKNMEKFYLGLLKEELLFIIDNLKTQQLESKLDKALFEQKITVPLDEKGDIIFKGFVDKILYNSDKENPVAAIVDYKTGHPELNLDNIIYGLDMQLPVYAYLLKHFEPLKNATIGGFYLQKILNSEKTAENKKSALKLQGYSNSNTRFLKEVDIHYEDSALIKSLKMSKGNFYAYSKVLTDNQIDKLIEIVEEKIKEAAENILKGNFAINPKEINGNNLGCKFCTYKDICFIKNENITKLAKKKKEEFLGGDEDGLD